VSRIVTLYIGLKRCIASATLSLTETRAKAEQYYKTWHQGFGMKIEQHKLEICSISSHHILLAGIPMLQIIKRTTLNKKEKNPLHVKEWFKGGTMQKQLTSFVLAILFGWLLGCNSNPVQGPDQNSNQVSPAGQKIQLLKLPGTAGMKLAKTSSIASSILRWVSVDSGGDLESSEQFGTVTVTATLSIPKKALSNDQYISMTLDDSKLKIDFDPDGLQFNVPAELSYTATGLDLSSLPAGVTLKLYYCNQKTGKFEQMTSASITYDRKSGTLTCLNAEIPHFSIYAFGYIKKYYDPDGL